MLLLLSALALAGDCTLEKGVYLLTMSPGDSMQNIFGHTAVLVYDPEQAGFSPVYDYGHFDDDPIVKMAYEVLTMTKPYFMGSRSLADTIAIYDSWGRSITAQQLLLTPAQQSSLALQLSNDLNGDLTFPYNWYRPNCTTMVQERIDRVLDGGLKTALASKPGPSPAGEVLRHTGPHLPLWFGLHWGSGGYARSPVDAWSGAFLPDRLMTEAATVTLSGRNLVGHTCLLGNTPQAVAAPERTSRDGLLWALGLAGAGLLGAAAPRRGFASGLVGVYGLATGLFGATALLVGSLGTFAPFWGAHNLAFASPANLLLAIAAWVAHRSPASKAPLAMAGLVGAVAVVGALLGLAQGHENLGLFGLLGLPSLAAAFALRPSTPG